jgi:hypothetical protein
MVTPTRSLLRLYVHFLACFYVLFLYHAWVTEENQENQSGYRVFGSGIETVNSGIRTRSSGLHYREFCWCLNSVIFSATSINRLTPNDPYMGRTAPLTSKRCILYIYSTNIGTEYFKHALYSPFFSLQNAVCFIMLTSLVPVLFTFYIQVC